MRMKAIVLIEWDYKPLFPNTSERDDLEGLLSQMDEVGKLRVETDILKITEVSDVANGEEEQ